MKRVYFYVKNELLLQHLLPLITKTLRSTTCVTVCVWRTLLCSALNSSCDACITASNALLLFLRFFFLIWYQDEQNNAPWEAASSKPNFSLSVSVWEVNMKYESTKQDEMITGSQVCCWVYTTRTFRLCALGVTSEMLRKLPALTNRLLLLNMFGTLVLLLFWRFIF